MGKKQNYIWDVYSAFENTSELNVNIDDVIHYLI